MNHKKCYAPPRLSAYDPKNVPVQMVPNETITALIENIKLLNTSIVAMSDELRHWGQGNRRRAVEEWASHELQTLQSSLADTPEAVESLTATERRSILKALVQTNGNTVKAARVLGIGRTTLYRRLREYKAKNHSRIHGGSNRKRSSVRVRT
jgi:DNA-binding NtrC family response regulator